MERLTTNKPEDEMSMLELAYNSCYAKDGKARYRDYDTDIDARELATTLYKKYADIEIPSTAPDELFDDWMLDDLQKGMDSIEGVLALLYRNLWAMADLRETLKAYEDKQEQGLLISLPCKVGDKVYIIVGKDISEQKVVGFKISSIDGLEVYTMRWVLSGSDFGREAFLTRSEAEEALARMGE